MVGQHPRIKNHSKKAKSLYGLANRPDLVHLCCVSQASREELPWACVTSGLVKPRPRLSSTSRFGPCGTDDGKEKARHTHCSVGRSNTTARPSPNTIRGSR